MTGANLAMDVLNVGLVFPAFIARMTFTHAPDAAEAPAVRAAFNEAERLNAINRASVAGSRTTGYNACTMREGYEPIGDPHYDNPEHWKPGTFGHHELLDRVRLVADLGWKKVEEHPTARHDTELSRRTEEIGSLMEQLYQYVGGLDIDETTPAHIREAAPSWGS